MTCEQAGIAPTVVVPPAALVGHHTSRAWPPLAMDTPDAAQPPDGALAKQAQQLRETGADAAGWAEALVGLPAGHARLLDHAANERCAVRIFIDDIIGR